MYKAQREADGYGELIMPGGYILKNVIRVHSKRKTRIDAAPYVEKEGVERPGSHAINRRNVEAYLDSDTTYFYQETYQWYAEGSRYPVFEIKDSWWENKGEIRDDSKGSYVYSPSDQLNDLLEDKPNLLVLNSGNDPTGTDVLPQVTSDCRIYPNPVDNELQVEVSSEQAVPVQIYLYDMQGRLLHTVKPSKQQTYLHETIDMNKYATGNYLLRVLIGSKSEQKVIIKK